jgi:threonine synthase
MKNLLINSQISLGEGNTPLIRLYSLEKKLRWKGQLWAKAEYQNPTGSFKDRGSVWEINEAIKSKKRGVVCASTGNMAASLSAYAARAKLKCYVVVPDKTSSVKLNQALKCGARLVKVKGTYDICVEKAKKIALEKNLLLCGDYEIRRTAQRSIGKELAKSGLLFKAFICPVGNGTVGCAVVEGFIEEGQCPKFIGIQGKGADPITQAWQKKTAIKNIDTPKTIASAMKVGKPLDGNLTLNWVRKTDGCITSVSDDEISEEQKALAQNEGIYIESAAAATVAGFKRVADSLNKSTNIVFILTGSGLKEGGDRNE